MSNGRAAVSPHQPERPSWRCRHCAEEWPCIHRRTEIVHDADGQVLTVALMMSSYFSEALTDHPAASVHVLHLRFLGWVRPAARIYQARGRR